MLLEVVISANATVFEPGVVYSACGSVGTAVVAFFALFGPFVPFGFFGGHELHFFFGKRVTHFVTSSVICIEVEGFAFEKIEKYMK